MKAFTSLAILGSAINAQRFLQDKEEANEFLSFAGKFNKHYKSLKDLDDHVAVWQANKARVQQLKENKKSLAEFDLNETGDLTDAEYKQMLGLIQDSAEQIEVPNTTIPDDLEDSLFEDIPTDEDGRRNLQADFWVETINWATNAHASPVKNQGQCGSCWAFAATTTQEIMQSIKTGKPVERLSEQEGLDCASQNGCFGSSINSYWKMSLERGSQSYADYPYEMASWGNCRKQDGKRIASKAETWGQIRWSLQQPDNIAQIKAQLMKGPLTVEVAADNDCWRWYKAGMVTVYDQCSGVTNHAVVLVGHGYFYGHELWVVQNSWGPQWGYNGLIFLQVSPGYGVSGMNMFPRYMEVQDGYPFPEQPPSGSGIGQVVAP